jgi:mannose-6-phosphate isomerase-like protein (cupin superfamily)
MNCWKIIGKKLFIGTNVFYYSIVNIGVKRMQIVNEQEMPEKGGVRYIIRGPHIDWGVITLQPGQAMGPHLHNEVEETFYIMEGTTTFVLKDKEYDAKAGTALRLEPTESHGLKNKGTTVTKMIFIKDIYRPDDKVNC